jgi:hypothetical protein
MYRPRLKYFKERKRNEFFPEVIVGTVDITVKTSHGLIITSNSKDEKKKVIGEPWFLGLTLKTVLN